MTVLNHTQAARADGAALSDEDVAFLEKLKGERYSSPSAMLAHVVRTFHCAERQHNAAAVCRELVRLGASLGGIGAYGRSALHFAAKADEVEVCRVLVELGADPKYSPPAQPAPNRYYAVKDGDVVAHTPFDLAVAHEAYKVVEFFVLECGLDPAARGPTAKTAIHFAHKSQPMKDLRRSLKTEAAIRKQAGHTMGDEKPTRAACGPEPL